MVVVVERDNFLSRRWRYRTGQHVTLLGPTGAGKSTLAYQLLGQSARPRRPGIVLAAKPRDTTTTKYTRALEFRLVRSWPAPWRPFMSAPPGYTVWPKHSFDYDADTERISQVFSATMRESYRRGDRIVYVDELYEAAEELGLNRDMIALWSRGRSMGCGLWGGSQRPAFVPQWAYGMADHLFLANDPDDRARRRYGEIGGVDSALVRDVVSELPEYHWLYIRRRPLAMCVVGP